MCLHTAARRSATPLKRRGPQHQVRDEAMRKGTHKQVCAVMERWKQGGTYRAPIFLPPPSPLVYKTSRQLTADMQSLSFLSFLSLLSCVLQPIQGHPPLLPPPPRPPPAKVRLVARFLSSASFPPHGQTLHTLACTPSSPPSNCLRSLTQRSKCFEESKVVISTHTRLTDAISQQQQGSTSHNHSVREMILPITVCLSIRLFAFACAHCGTMFPFASSVLASSPIPPFTCVSAAANDHNLEMGSGTLCWGRSATQHNRHELER